MKKPIKELNVQEMKEEISLSFRKCLKLEEDIFTIAFFEHLCFKGQLLTNDGWSQDWIDQKDEIYFARGFDPAMSRYRAIEIMEYEIACRLAMIPGIDDKEFFKYLTFTKGFCLGGALPEEASAICAERFPDPWFAGFEWEPGV